MQFQGFTEDTYRFLMELSLLNEKAFFEANRQRYVDGVQTPMRALAQDLLPTALKIDPAFNTKVNTIVSRIYRDARRTHGRAPYRDHAWLSFKHPQLDASDAFCLYFEIGTGGYGYGMGCYCPTPATMERMRGRILADPARFLALTQSPALEKFSLEGELYKRPRHPEALAALQPYLDRKGLSWCYFNTDLKRTLDGPALFTEVETAMKSMAALYQFLTFQMEI